MVSISAVHTDGQAYLSCKGQFIYEQFLLNFLADTIDLNMMADAAAEIGGRYSMHGSGVSIESLTQQRIRYSDGDLYMPILLALEHFQAWGWLTFESEEIESDLGLEMDIRITHEPICAKVAEILGRRVRQEHAD